MRACSAARIVRRNGDGDYDASSGNRTMTAPIHAASPIATSKVVMMIVRLLITAASLNDGRLTL